MFSVIIPTKNRAETLPRALASVLNQTFRDFEIIVADSYSTDGTTDIIRTMSCKSELIRLLPLGEEVRRSQARNEAIAVATHPKIAFLDSDDWWAPTYLQEHARFPAAHYTFTLETWMRHGDVGELVGFTGQDITSPLFMRNKEMDFFPYTLEHAIAFPSALVVDRTVIDNVGNFDTEIDIPETYIAEDYDFILRVADVFKGIEIPQRLVFRDITKMNFNPIKYDRGMIKSLQKYLKNVTEKTPESHVKAASKFLAEFMPKVSKEDL